MGGSIALLHSCQQIMRLCGIMSWHVVDVWCVGSYTRGWCCKVLHWDVSG